MNDDILLKIDSEIGKDNKVVELRRKIEELTNENDYWKRKCSEMGIALKTYEKGRYQEHLENERLNNIIKEIRDFTKIGSMTYKHILGDFEVIEVESLLKILDKENV